MRKKELERRVLDLEIELDKLKAKDIGPEQMDALWYRLKMIEESIKPRRRRRIDRRRRRHLDQLEMAAAMMEAHRAKKNAYEE
jgi:hypothetical protein